MPAVRDHPLLLLFLVVPVLCAMVELGHRLAKRYAADDDKQAQFAVARDQSGVLLSLMLGFTLALGLSRYDMRTAQTVEEANAIGTARLRASLISEPERSEALRLFDEYVDTRGDPSSARSAEIQAQLWTRANVAAERNRDPITGLFVSSVNEMIDAGGKRIAGLENRIPPAVWTMLGLLAMLSSLMAGMSARKRSIAGMLVPALMFAIVALLIADLDTPGRGLIHVDQRSIERLHH